MMITRMIHHKNIKLVVVSLMVILSIVVMKPSTTTLIFLTNSSNVVNAYSSTIPFINIYTNNHHYNNHDIRSSMQRHVVRQQKTQHHHMDGEVENNNSNSNIIMNNNNPSILSRKDMIQSILLIGITSLSTTKANAIDIQHDEQCTVSSSLSSFTLSSESSSSSTATTIVTGTKQDPKYEACLSQCMYTCTKPKGYEQKSRAECLPDCKQQCATTKQQLMIGTPIINTTTK